MDDRIEATASVDLQSDFVLVGTYGGILYCVDVNTGQIHWEYKECKDIIKTRPACLGGQVVFGCHDGIIRCLNILDGTLRWKKEVGSPCSAIVIVTTES